MSPSEVDKNLHTSQYLHLSTKRDFVPQRLTMHQKVAFPWKKIKFSGEGTIAHPPLDAFNVSSSPAKNEVIKLLLCARGLSYAFRRANKSRVVFSVFLSSSSTFYKQVKVDLPRFCWLRMLRRHVGSVSYHSS